LKLVVRILAVVSMFLLLFAGMLHGASLAGAVTGIVRDGTPAVSILKNFFQHNFTDPIFIATTAFTISYFSIFAVIAHRKDKMESRGFSSQRGEFFLSLLVYITAAVACGITLYVLSP